MIRVVVVVVWDTVPVQPPTAVQSTFVRMVVVLWRVVILVMMTMASDGKYLLLLLVEVVVLWTRQVRLLLDHSYYY